MSDGTLTPIKNEVTPSLLVEFQERMKLSDEEDNNLTRILKASIEDLTDKCGDYDVHKSERFKELVFERSRYAYNDALEYFDLNFQRQINTLALNNAFAEQRAQSEGEANEA